MTVSRRLSTYYGSISFCSAILHNVFLLYHIETFVSIYKIDKTSFWVGETIFLIWNSCNDPLFGWISDKNFLMQKQATSNRIIVLRRIKALEWNGPLFAVSFLMFWVSWTFPWIQLILCLCVYDSFLTMIDLHHSALLADLCISADDRTTLNFHSSVFNALGSLSVFVSYVVWNKENLLVFQVFCGVLAVVSACGFWFSAHKMKDLFRNPHSEEKLSQCKTEEPVLNCRFGVGGDIYQPDEKQALKKFVQDLAGHKNFIWFAAMNLVQVFHCHFNSNFFPLFLDNLLGDSIPQIVCSFILGISFVAPHINNLYFLSLCRRYGVYMIIKALFIIKLSLSLVMLYLGPGHMWLLCIYIASNRVFTEGTCKLLTLVISDLVDEDYVLNKRKQAVSALMFGTAALLSKPGQTLAPLVGTWLLAQQTGHDVFETGTAEDSMKLDLSSMSVTEQELYRSGVFSLLVYVPVVCASIQLLVWSQFTLKGKRLHWVKDVRQGSKYTTV